MTTDPRAIRSFLDRKLPERVDFKSMSAGQLQQFIVDCTGYAQQSGEGVPPIRKHQLAGLAFGLFLKQAMLIFPPRAGKTRIAFEWAAHLKRAGLWRGIGLVVPTRPSPWTSG